MGLLSFLSGSKPEKTQSMPGIHDPKWVRSPAGKFQRLIYISLRNKALRGGGVYVVWHGGISPRWLYVGETNDIAATLAELQDTKEIVDHEGSGGVFVTWSPIAAQFRPGVLRYLADTMKPLIANPRLAAHSSAEPVAVYHPGREPRPRQAAKVQPLLGVDMKAPPPQAEGEQETEADAKATPEH